jgi:very-short-patch-repair endonuclease
MVNGLVPRDNADITRSDAERKLLRLISQAGLPRPETNARVAGYEVDFLWRDHRLVVEVDGYAFHGHRLAFERDRAKQQALTAHGERWASGRGSSSAGRPRCRGASA